VFYGGDLNVVVLYQFPILYSFLGVTIKQDIEALKLEIPHIVVGTPGRVVELATTRKVLDLSHVKHFVLDECDRMLVNSNKFYPTILQY